MEHAHAYHKTGKVCEVVTLTTSYISGLIERRHITPTGIPVTIAIYLADFSYF